MNFTPRGRSHVFETLLIVLAAAGSLPAFATETHEFDVPAEGGLDAIRDFASQADVQILIAGENIKDKRLRAVSGEYSTDQGLHILLADSGLAPQYLGNHSIALVTAGDSDVSLQKQLLGDRLHLAQATPGTPAGRDEGKQKIEEVVVSAQKRDENLQSVPVPVSVVNTTELTEKNQTLLKDYVTSVPGLTFQADIVGQQELSIRGITQGGSGTPTVGLTIDDVPYGGSTSASGGNYLPDFDPGDLARIEVLRGPQGALYGSNSMGGLVKLVTIDPSTGGFSGRVSAGTSSVSNGNDNGFNIRGSANIPVSDTFAVRVSGYRRQDPGYIDNPALQLSGVNQSESEGGRVSALWKPTDSMSLKLNAMYQSLRWNGASDVEVAPGLSPWQQNYIAGAGGYDRVVRSYSVVFNAKAGDVDLVSITGYSQSNTHSTLDFGYVFGNFFDTTYGASGAPYNGFINPTKFSQEIRLSGTILGSLDWRVGGFYTHEHDSVLLTIFATDATNGQVINPYFSNQYFPTYDEYAPFVDLTYHVTDRFDVQIGGRESHYRNSNGLTVESGDAFVPNPTIAPNVSVSANNFTYLLTPRFTFSPDLMMYARLASGYRPGGPQAAAVVAEGAPSSYKADQTRNYEFGVKADFLNHVFSVDASVFYINWRDLQLTLLSPKNSFQYTANGGAAKSEGVELSVVGRPLRGLTLSTWVDYDHAVLTDAFPTASTVTGNAGDRLPIDPRISAHFSFDEDFRLPLNVIGFAGGEVSYVGDREGSFTATPPRQDFPAYTKTDLHAGVRSDSWTATFYVNNVANTRGLVGGGVGYDPPNAFIYITPRTVGLTLTKTFEPR